MRRLLTVLAAVVLVLSLTAVAFAGMKASSSRSLYFNGNTAEVSASVSQNGAVCTLTVELYRGGTRVAYWYADGIGSASVSDSVSGCISGSSYTLRVSGTVDGQTVNFSPITKTCP